MKLRRINESIDDLLQNIEYAVLPLRDNGFFVTAMLNGSSIEISIKLKDNKFIELEFIYSYLEEIFDYIKEYDRSITDFVIQVNYQYINIGFLDKTIGKTILKPLSDINNFNELKDSIDFCLFSNVPETKELGKFHQIKFFIE